MHWNASARLSPRTRTGRPTATHGTSARSSSTSSTGGPASECSTRSSPGPAYRAGPTPRRSRSAGRRSPRSPTTPMPLRSPSTDRRGPPWSAAGPGSRGRQGHSTCSAPGGGSSRWPCRATPTAWFWPTARHGSTSPRSRSRSATTSSVLKCARMPADSSSTSALPSRTTSAAPRRRRRSSAPIAAAARRWRTPSSSRATADAPRPATRAASSEPWPSCGRPRVATGASSTGRCRFQKGRCA